MPRKPRRPCSYPGCPELVYSKREIAWTINNVKDKEMRSILEKRYLCFDSWEKIAVDMNYSIQHIFRLHNKALKSIVI